MANHTLFLTREQALNAICLDFRGYGPQPMLFCAVLDTLYGGRVSVKRETGKDGLWLCRGPKHRMRWLAGTELIEYMCRAVMTADITLDGLARLCSQIFQTSCHPHTSRRTGRQGVKVDTGMQAFTCRQCGRCCTQLDYHDGLTARDVQRLEALGRDDVLKWIGRTKRGDNDDAYSIWITPGTNQYAHPCPFLKQGSANSRYVCTIHNVKPAICRHYPVSRKHARMTGCPGFD